jgi:GNAT superfamily N-acetyltransferase
MKHVPCFACPWKLGYTLPTKDLMDPGEKPNMPTIPTLTTYLEMHHPGMPDVEAPRASVRIEYLPTPSIDQYRRLYNSVGQDYYWVDRNRMPDDQLKEILADPRVKIAVLYVKQEVAGFSELDCRDPQEIELAYFGLFPQFIGQGLGRYFLCETLKWAWSFRPRRVWVHTCDLDHKAALNTYLRAGFEIYDRRVIQQVIPEG